jgi:hypothetical protein
MLHCNISRRGAGGRPERIMAWIADFSTPFAEERTARAWRFPIGLGSPLWAIFGAAATGAVAYWWLTR